MPVRWISGRIMDADYPRSAVRARASGTVFLRFVVAPNGRVSDCGVTRSSGNRDLDETTCRLIVRRFRYRPAMDAEGRPVSATIRGEHVWELGAEPDPIELEPTEIDEGP
jgi:protein TonB